MQLDPTIAQTFSEDYRQILLMVYALQGLKGHRTPEERMVAARRCLFREAELLDEAVAALEGRRGMFVDEDVVAAMRTLEVGKWIYLRDLRHHTILLHPDGVIAFGVVGLTQPIRALTGGPGFLFEAGIMAIEGHFVCDGLLGETVALGWTNSHLHRFRIHGEDYMPVDQENEPGTRDEKVPLKRVDLRLKTKIRYDYDFGDSWEHQILVEGLLLLEEPAEVPACIGGQRKCPPEDCGGAGGYQEMLDALRNPRDPRGEELRIWLGTRTWDAESFDLGQVNEAIAKAIAPRGGRRGAASRS